MIFQIIFAVALIIILVVVGVLSLIYIFRTKQEKPNQPIILNFASHKSKKRFLGTLISSQPAKSGREIIKYWVKDLLDDAESEFADIIAEPNKKIISPKGIGLSADRDIIMILPHKAEDIPEEIKNSDIGKAMQLLIEIKNIEWHVNSAVREGTKRREDIMKELSDGELGRDLIKLQKQILHDTVTSILQVRDTKPTKEGEVGGKPQV